MVPRIPPALAKYDRWIRLIALASTDRSNEEMLMTFFLRECGSDPSHFAEFILGLKILFASLKPLERKSACSQYLRVLSPLCERFGLFSEKQEMDAYCFKQVDPKMFAKTGQILAKYRQKSKSTVQRIIQAFAELLKKKGHKADISGRYKHIYSIHRKLEAKGYSSPLALQDIFAFRIILESNDPHECFDVLNLLNDTYTPIASRFKDYISIPKVNGYQSIHTVLNNVLPELDLPVEVQIRTRAMDEFAEHGLASHWLYSKNKKTQMLSVRERQLLEHYQSLSHDLAHASKTVYCVTPAGKLVDLPNGATVKDFAHRIHTELGKKATGAFVNGKQTDCGQTLQLGDTVRILTASEKTHVS